MRYWIRMAVGTAATLTSGCSPDELTSVYDDSAYADIASDLLERLRAQYSVLRDDRPVEPIAVNQ